MATAQHLVLQPGDRIHLMGVGGVGMSALAAVLAVRGFAVTGSDCSEGLRVQHLREVGVRVSVPQVAGGAGDADVVVVSTAIPADNPELAEARERGLPIYHRSHLLAAIVDGMQKVAVSGTHGKTTTTSMLATILLECGRDPLVVVGGDAANLGANYHVGSEPLAVFEACESDRSFLRYGPCSEVITNVEADHLDQHGTFGSVCEAFEQFIDLVPGDGFLAYGTESAELAEIARSSRGRLIPFGLGGDVELGADEIEFRPWGVGFRLLVGERPVGRTELEVPGEHNVRNALGALAAARALGLEMADALAALEQFHGVGRRFELIGEFSGALVVDDYAHHPTEVAATLATARRGWPERRLVAIFQPHLYSRTRDFMDEFARALAAADVVVIADIYGAREEPIEGVHAADLARAVLRLAPTREVRFIPEKQEIVDAVRRLVQPGDLVLTIGAGDIREVAEEVACA